MACAMIRTQGSSMMLGVLLVVLAASSTAEPSSLMPKEQSAQSNLLRKVAPAPRDAKTASSPAAGKEVLPVVAGTSVVSDTIYKDVVSKADAMEERVNALREQARENLKNKRQQFKASLEIQKSVVDKVEADNENIASEIDDFGRQAAALKIEAVGLMQANDILKESLLHMLSKVTLAGDFLEDSINDTEPAMQAEKLERLLAPPTRDVQFYLEEARKELHSVSLIQSVRAGEINSTSSEAIVESLADTLERVKQATRDGTAKLKASYVAASKSLAEGRANATQHQGELVQARVNAEAHVKAMQTAVDYLMSQHNALMQRVAGVQAFGAKLETGVDAVLLQAKHLTKAGA